MTEGQTLTARQRDKADRRRALLDAAKRQMATYGYLGVRLDDIAGEAGISGPAVYRHFRSKDAVLAALMVGISDELRDGGRRIVREKRLPLLVIGVATGLLGSLPTLLWVSSVIMIVLFPVIALLAIWLYVVIFVFSALWFAHYCLRALSRLRAEDARHEPTLAGTVLPVVDDARPETEDLPPALPPPGSPNGSP